MSVGGREQAEKIWVRNHTGGSCECVGGREQAERFG